MRQLAINHSDTKHQQSGFDHQWLTLLHRQSDRSFIHDAAVLYLKGDILKTILTTAWNLSWNEAIFQIANLLV
ncbi:MAG: hypothetical protein IPL08_13595, partial [Saprospiraceae bacterium]|nr:hypothetical protein [Saprospiraceae bacterium]